MTAKRTTRARCFVISSYSNSYSSSPTVSLLRCKWRKTFKRCPDAVPSLVFHLAKRRGARQIRKHGRHHQLRPSARCYAGYQQATTQLLPYDAGILAVMTPDELARVESQYASVELSDGANVTAMATLGAIRNNAANLETQIGNLEQDSLSGDPDLNTEVSVLNKINSADVLNLRSVQDTNKLLASLLELQTVAAKQQREATTNAINADIARRATLAGNLAQVTATITDSLQNFRMP